jgi:16S rRNA processing protein RimM
VTIARIIKPQGRRGEVAAELLTDFPERFADRRRVQLLFRSGERSGQLSGFEIEDFWPHKGRVVLKFAGVDSISDAEKLAGADVQIPKVERAPLEGNAAYASDLVGCAVFEVGGGIRRELGVIDDVLAGAGEAPLLVVKSGGRELLIPFAEEFLRKLDIAGRTVEMALPEGLLDVDAPLSGAEKQEQQTEGKRQKEKGKGK